MYVELKVNPKRVEIMPMSEKWGSCTSDGVVTFADDLASAHEDFQDYVIVHPLLHLRYKSHGKRFQAVMTAMIPRWRELEAQGRH
jgi:predicted metal-dependent hydrolase